ncbi:conserved Plasmodium protein, unknown function [Plasmodium knowlesi strain H]|uniref:Uncharacterized protein n=3 Tax=Plasmodium knowlesi TaxID=5850 RepID=A0A5K1VG68_PLAKH|nr:conserved protein, unknown function [Plasmodium knowlesi strain H]OTN67108.1 Uncharacterized protein PKNOH_S07451100 [Plasmodium knowlesi]CAA9988638.1 conserved protein, unknown function [Plasmodium knowlesi strain H]SBO21494.1 conserved Plasmodium protein, unknown function [Plasmodium knowlesi strain H]SBO21912.1 conserved Plasmodium protein, unknown function [Plasmodium knowlesi strain H]VVS78112.1 conserved protein, unknown function [Plasmodium knowlesi strain H]|eukprot:XP_002259614.1 hypothetical protein, conserved in Plasmodium species [Plasmodium knowlesi strain H]
MVTFPQWCTLLLALILLTISTYTSKIVTPRGGASYNKVTASAHHGRNRKHLSHCDQIRGHCTRRLFFLKKEKQNDSRFKGLQELKSLLNYLLCEILPGENDHGMLVGGQKRWRPGLENTLDGVLYPPYDVQRAIRCYTFPSRDGGDERDKEDSRVDSNVGNTVGSTMYNRVEPRTRSSAKGREGWMGAKRKGGNCTGPAQIERYITRQLIHLTSELIKIQNEWEKDKQEENAKVSSSLNGKTNSRVKWNYYLNKKNNPLKCFVYVDVPEGTVMLKPEKVDDKKKKFLISISALNDIRRNNKEILKNIYFKKHEITFDDIYRNSNCITLLVSTFIDHPYLLNALSFFCLTSCGYLLTDVFYQGVLHLLSSEVIWNPLIYNVWCNVYHTTLPLKLYLAKQTYSYGKVAFDFFVNYVRSKIIKLETSLMNSSLKGKVDLDNREENRYDDKMFSISTQCDISDEEEEDFTYI